MNKLLTILIFICTSLQANAQLVYKYSYELSYQNQSITLSGIYFNSYIPVRAKSNTYQLSNLNIVDTFRNIITASSLNDYKWLKLHSINQDKDYLKDLSKRLTTSAIQMKGFVVFKNYAIILAKQNKGNKQFIIPLIKQDDNSYYIDESFREKYRQQHDIIFNAYIGRGEFKVMRKK